MLNSNFFIADHRIVITGKKPVTVSVCAVANYNVVIVKWCLQPGLRHLLLGTLCYMSLRRSTGAADIVAAEQWQTSNVPTARLPVQGPMSDSGWDVGGVSPKLRPCSAPVGGWER